MPERIIINRLPDELPDGVQLWPSSLPDALYSGYSFSEKDGRLITEMEQGKPKIRAGYGDQPRTYSLSFLFSREQLKIFIDFYRSDMRKGVLPAALVVSDERGFAYSYVTIINQLRYAPSTRRGHFSLQINALEVGRP